MLLDADRCGLPVVLSLFTSIIISVPNHSTHPIPHSLVRYQYRGVDSGGVLFCQIVGSKLMREGVIIKPGILKLMGVILLEGEGL